MSTPATGGAQPVPASGTPAAGTLMRGPLRATTVGLLIVITLIAFEEMAVAAALPTAARDLHGLAAYGWAFTGYLITSVLGMVISGQMSDRAGARWPVLIGMAGFIAGLVIAGSATSMVELIAGRLAQGLSGGLLITALYVIIGDRYPDALQPKVMAATSSAWVVPSLLGPALSGALAQHASWRWTFLGLVPFAVLGAVLLLPVLRTLPHTSMPLRQVLRDRRRLVLALAVAAGIAALEQVGQHPSWAGLPIGVAGAVCLIWGLRGLLPTGTASVRPGVAAPVALRGLFAGAMFGAETSLPLSISVQHGYGAIEAALPLTVSALTWALGSWWQGRRRPGADLPRRRRQIAVGFGCLALAAGLIALGVQPAVSPLVCYPAWALAGLGAGLTMTNANVLLLRYTTDATRGADSAALQLSDATSAALTSGFGGVLIALAAHAAVSYTTAFTTLDLAMCALAVLGVLVAHRVGPPRA